MTRRSRSASSAAADVAPALSSTPSARRQKSSTRKKATTPKTSPKAHGQAHEHLVVALADLFEERLDDAHAQPREARASTCPRSSASSASTPTKKLLANPEINYIILATPPHFRPAPSQGRHRSRQERVHGEAGRRRCARREEWSWKPASSPKQKNLGIAAGTQRRHSPELPRNLRRIHDGAIGDIVYAKCYWNGGQIWVVDREPEWSDTEWQIRNWNHFTWLSGDHIVEQHVHNLDIMNWVIGTHPIKAVSALGGRQSRRGKRHGHIFDHFAVEYEYPNGVTMFSQCRQIKAAKTSSANSSAAPKAQATAPISSHRTTGENGAYPEQSRRTPTTGTPKPHRQHPRGQAHQRGKTSPKAP